jgi:serine/alanine adding enzyme
MAFLTSTFFTGIVANEVQNDPPRRSSWDSDVVDIRAREPSFVPDVYFGHDYGRADALSLEGEWMTLADSSGAWQMPLVVTELGDGLREGISPYGYAGIHVAEGVTSSEAMDAWDVARDRLGSLGVVSLFLRFNPLDPDSVAAASRFDELTVRRNRTTFTVATDDPDLMWSRLRSSCRSRIRKARKHGYSAEVRPASGRDLAPGGDFRRLYDLTMQRLDAAPLYFFGDDYYAELIGGLGPKLLLVEVRDRDGVVVSSALVLRHQQRLHYHLAGSSPDGAVMGSNNLMMWTAAEFAAIEGLDRFHLGGGRGGSGSDGLARFKSTFGGVETDFHTGHAVIDAAAYSHLTQARADQLGTSTGVLEESGFFPAFRADAG